MDKRISQQVEREHTSPIAWNLKILMLSWEFPPNVVGGLSRHVYSLAAQLAEMGHEVHVLTAGNENLPATEWIKGVRVHRVRPLNERDEFISWIGGLNLAMVYKAEKLADEIHFTIIHVHDWLTGSAAIYLKNSLSIPLLSTIHATEHGRNNGIHTEMQQFIHEKEVQLIGESDHVIVCSQYMKDNLLSIFQVDNEKMTVIPNGIDPRTVSSDYQEIFPELKDKKYVFSIGRIVKEKGFETLIEAALIAKEKELDTFFVIAGKGPMLENYRKQIAEKELEKHIAFVGYVTDGQRNALIYGSELAVFPSLYEPFGIVALETMVLGKPTIVSNTGGLKGIVKHMQTGLLMIPGDANSLLNQIDFLIQNPKTAQEIGNKGMQIAKSMYGWKRIASETVRVMEDTILNNLVLGNEKKAIEGETPNS